MHGANDAPKPSLTTQRLTRGRSEPQADLAESQGADRKAKLEEEKRERWAAKDRGAKEPWNDRPKIYSKEFEVIVFVYVNTSKQVRIFDPP